MTVINRRFDDERTPGKARGGTLLRPPDPDERDDEFQIQRFLEATPPPRPAPRKREPRPRPWLADILAILFLCLVAVALTWPLARDRATALPDLGDPVDSAWRLTWPLHQALQDPRLLLDANTAYPFETAYLFDELILGVAIVVAPLWYLTHNGVLAVNAALLIAFIGNGLAMYLLSRHLTGNRAAAVAGALVFAVAPFRFEHLGHVGLSTAFWLPLALYFLDRTIIGGRWRDALLFGVCCAFQALSAQYYGFQTAIVVGLFLLWTAIRRPQWLFQSRCLVQIVVAVVLAETILLPVVVPYIAVKETWGYSRGLEENELHSATLSSFLSTPPQNIVGGQIATTLRGALGVREGNIWLYPGLGATALALLGVARRRKWWSPPGAQAIDSGSPPDTYSFFLTLAALATALCLGPTLHLQQIVQGQGATTLMPYRLFFNVIPFFDAMRAPERFGNMLLLGLGAAASFGVAALLPEVGAARAGWGGKRFAQAMTRGLAALLLIAVVGAEYAQRPLTLATVPPTPPIYGWLATQPGGPVLELPMTIPPTEPNREQLRQYWSTANWFPRLNASSDIAPRAYAALRRELTAFPDARTVALLQGLGVRYVIIHRAQYSRPEWDALTARLASQRPALTLREERGDDLVYELTRDDRIGKLLTLIPAGDSVFLSGEDPAELDTYMAMIGWRLSDGRALVTKIVPTFGQRHIRPEPGQRSDWLILYQNEAPPRYGYPDGLPVVYEDGVVRVYQHARPK
jgi:hypothetical protein